MRRIPKPTVVRYFAFGAIAATLQVVTLTLFVEIAHLDKVISSVSAFYIAVVTNYFLQSFYTFNSDEPHRTAMPKFIAISTIGAGINTLTFFILLKVIHYIPAQCIALLLVFMFNYNVSKKMVFRR